MDEIRKDFTHCLQPKIQSALNIFPSMANKLKGFIKQLDDIENNLLHCDHDDVTCVKLVIEYLISYIAKYFIS